MQFSLTSCSIGKNSKYHFHKEEYFWPLLWREGEEIEEEREKERCSVEEQVAQATKDAEKWDTRLLGTGAHGSLGLDLS